MKIGIIGTGYVGLVTGVMLSNLRHNVVCVDKDINKVKRLNSGEAIIFEKDLDVFLKSSLENKTIIFSDSYSDLIDCEAVFICVGTPSLTNGMADLSYVFASVKSAIQIVGEDCLIIIKSTVPPGSANKIQSYIKEENYNHIITSNPEFLREGSAVYDFENPDRIVFGSEETKGFEILEKIYEKKIEKNVPIIKADLNTAEMIKYTSNSFLAIKLSFINEMANLCENIGADIEVLSDGVGLDSRIGRLFLRAGPGYGGSCFPKDTNALSYIAKEYNSESIVLDAAIKSNLLRYNLMKNKIKNICKGSRKLAVWGLAFKAETDDVRESPSVEIIKLLKEEGFEIKAYDPVANKNFEGLGLDVEVAESAEESCKDAEAIVILTEWPEFRKIDLNPIKDLVSKKVIIDLRKVVDADLAKSLGFEYHTIGKVS